MPEDVVVIANPPKIAAPNRLAGCWSSVHDMHAASDNLVTLARTSFMLTHADAA